MFFYIIFGYTPYSDFLFGAIDKYLFLDEDVISTSNKIFSFWGGSDMLTLYYTSTIIIY